jgi:hypothetical protein
VVGYLQQQPQQQQPNTAAFCFSAIAISSLFPFLGCLYERLENPKKKKRNI